MRIGSLTRRGTIGLCAAALAAGALSAPPASAAQPGADEDVITTLNALTVSGKVGLNTRTGKAREVGALKAVSNLVDTVTGRVVGKGTMRMNVASEGYTPGLRSCIKDGKNKRLTTFEHFDRYLEARRGGSVHFQYHPYRIGKARQVEGAASTQWEVCSVGGGDLDKDRLRQVGTGIALDDTANFRRIGQAWQTGSTPENYTLGLGFEVKKDPVSVSASLTQHPVDKLMGSHRGPYSSFLDAYDRNAVNAWWQDNCIGRWYGCVPKSGSKDYQGAIAHGLWEFPQGTEPAEMYFYFVLYAAT